MLCVQSAWKCETSTTHAETTYVVGMSSASKSTQPGENVEETTARLSGAQSITKPIILKILWPRAHRDH